MTREEAINNIHLFIQNYNIDEYANVSVLIDLIDKIYDDFENCKKAKNGNNFIGCNIHISKKVNNPEEKKKYRYTCNDCGIEWTSNNEDESKCPMCGNENIDIIW